MKFVSVEKSGEVKAIARSMASVDGMCIVRVERERPMPYGPDMAASALFTFGENVKAHGRSFVPRLTEIEALFATL